MKRTFLFLLLTILSSLPARAVMRVDADFPQTFEVDYVRVYQFE